MAEFFNSRQQIVKKGDVLFDEPTKIIHVEFDALGPGVYEVTVINNGDYVVNKVKYLEDKK
jgi:hypothetical protein